MIGWGVGRGVPLKSQTTLSERGNVTGRRLRVQFPHLVLFMFSLCLHGCPLASSHSPKTFASDELTTLDCPEV